MFWIAIAAQTAATSPPSREKVQGLISAQDYPQGALDRGEQGPVAVQVVINPEGLVDGCTVIASSRYKDLDEQTCRIITTRARFSPVHGDKGRAIYGLYRTVITWSINSPISAHLRPDVELTINHGPEGVSLPLEIRVSYIIESNGAVTHCKRSDETPTAPQVLVDVACQALVQNSASIVRNRKGEPVEAGDTARVRFSIDSLKG